MAENRPRRRVRPGCSCCQPGCFEEVRRDAMGHCGHCALNRQWEPCPYDNCRGNCNGMCHPDGPYRDEGRAGLQNVKNRYREDRGLDRIDWDNPDMSRIDVFNDIRDVDHGLGLMNAGRRHGSGYPRAWPAEPANRLGRIRASPPPDVRMSPHVPHTDPMNINYRGNSRHHLSEGYSNAQDPNRFRFDPEMESPDYYGRGPSYFPEEQGGGNGDVWSRYGRR